MLKIDQGYSLKHAIYAFARPEDRAKEKNFLDKWQRRFEKTKKVSRQLETEKIALVETRLKQELDTKIKVLWDSLLKKYGGQIPERGAAALSSRNPITHGLLEALRNGAAIVFGRQGGLQNQKEQIEASLWGGEWEFQTLAGIAKGGAPHIEIHDLTVLRGDAAFEATSKRRGGRKAKFDWPAIEREAYCLMTHHGDISPDDDDWNSQACLVRALQEFCQKQFGCEPGDSSLKQAERVLDALSPTFIDGLSATAASRVFLARSGLRQRGWGVYSHA